MSSTHPVKWPAALWHLLLAAGPILVITACATEPADPATSDHAVEDKAGCTHIRFCSTPGLGEPHVITCDTNDKSCSSTARFNECRSDAQAVCGAITPMLFDPPIPCPISGVCNAGDPPLSNIGFP